MATKGIEITAILKSVRRLPDDKFRFRVHSLSMGGMDYGFILSREKALKLVNQNSEFPIGVKLLLRGRVSPTHMGGLNFVKIISVDGHDVQSWAERSNSPTVAPEVIKGAQRSIGEANDELMRRRAPPDPPPRFKSPLEAYETAMQRLMRQVRLKDPKLSKSDIWTIRDALNMLKEAAGL